MREENTLKTIFYVQPKYLASRVMSSFWFVPSLLTLCALFTAGALIGLDRFLQLEPNGSFGWLYSNSAEGARALLSTIAGSMITVTGVLLSAMIVVMTLASQQYGPRLVQNFIEDKASQTVIGCFVGCFIYSVIILKTIQTGEFVFIPHLSILGALLFTILCIALMLFFVHHLSSAIQVQAIMRRVYTKLTHEIDTLFPEDIGQAQESSNETEENKIKAAKASREITKKVEVTRSGYLQSIEHEKLLTICSQQDLFIHFQSTPGDFLINGAAVVEVYHSKKINDDLIEEIRSMFLIGTFPNCPQDIIFPIRQLEEIAIRALSPGINDPHTAIEAIDYLGSALAQLVERKQPSRLRFDDNQALRLVVQSPNFEEILRHAYQQIHHYGKDDVTIINKLFESLDSIQRRLEPTSNKRAVIDTFKSQILGKSLKSMRSEADQDIIQSAYNASE